VNKPLYIFLILVLLCAVLIYALPAKRTICETIETEIPIDSCKSFFQNSTHWEVWITPSPQDDKTKTEGEKSIVSMVDKRGCYCMARRLKKGTLSKIESIEKIEISTTEGACVIQWESTLICNYPLGRIEGYFEQLQRRKLMKDELSILDSALKTRYQSPPKAIDEEISIKEE